MIPRAQGRGTASLVVARLVVEVTACLAVEVTCLVVEAWGVVPHSTMAAVSCRQLVPQSQAAAMQCGQKPQNSRCQRCDAVVLAEVEPAERCASRLSLRCASIFFGASCNLCQLADPRLRSRPRTRQDGRTLGFLPEVVTRAVGPLRSLSFWFWAVWSDDFAS